MNGGAGVRRARSTALGALVVACALGGALRMRPVVDPPPTQNARACAAPSSFAGGPLELPMASCSGDGGAPGAVKLLLGVPLDLNTASVKDLEALPRMGTRTAERVVDHRARHGRFSSVEELENVRGIGPRTVQRLRPYVVAR